MCLTNDSSVCYRSHVSYKMRGIAYENAQIRCGIIRGILLAIGNSFVEDGVSLLVIYYTFLAECQHGRRLTKVAVGGNIQ